MTAELVHSAQVAAGTAAGPGSTTMNIDLLDYSGHPCQIQLSRELASRGHEVRHLYCPDYTSGKGATERREDDPATFSVRPVELGEEFDRYNPVSRIRQELRFGQDAAQAILDRRPDVAVICNVPLLAHVVLARQLKKAGVPMLFWQQDVYSHAIRSAATKKFGKPGEALGVVADRLERSVARKSERVVAIANAFLPTLDRWGVEPAVREVIPNWAPLEEMPEHPKDNPWSRAHGLADRFVMLYSGTLGLKHDPSVLLRLAEIVRDTDPEGRVVVVSQGAGRAYLEEHGAGIEQLVLLDYQPYEDLPFVLASADVLVALLEPEAGVFSVPSKTLNYLCAGRPTLAVMPPVNAAAQTLTEIEAGLVVPPGDTVALRTAALRLLGEPGERVQMGKHARAYAQDAFDVGTVADRFEALLTAARTSARP